MVRSLRTCWPAGPCDQGLPLLCWLIQPPDALRAEPCPGLPILWPVPKQCPSQSAGRSPLVLDKDVAPGSVHRSSLAGNTARPGRQTQSQSLNSRVSSCRGHTLEPARPGLAALLTPSSPHGWEALGCAPFMPLLPCLTPELAQRRVESPTLGPPVSFLSQTHREQKVTGPCRAEPWQSPLSTDRHPSPQSCLFLPQHRVCTWHRGHWWKAGPGGSWAGAAGPGGCRRGCWVCFLSLQRKRLASGCLNNPLFLAARGEWQPGPWPVGAAPGTGQGGLGLDQAVLILPGLGLSTRKAARQGLPCSWRTGRAAPHSAGGPGVASVLGLLGRRRPGSGLHLTGADTEAGDGQPLGS